MTSASARERFAAAVRSQPIDLGYTALLIATEAHPASAATDVRDGLRLLDTLAADVPTNGSAGDRLRSVLREFCGDRQVYERLDSSLLNRVLVNRRGLPILLSIVWLEVARRAEIPAYGIGLPGHFVVGMGDPDGFHEIVDPFDSGRAVHHHELATMVGQPLGAQDLRPWESAEILQRLLANIRRWADRPERLSTRRWAIELALLLPRHSVILQRQHAEVMLQLGGFLEAARSFECYAAIVERTDQSTAAAARLRAQQCRARLN